MTFLNSLFVIFLIFQTLLNRQHNYWASLAINYAILLISIWVAFRSAGGKLGKAVFQIRSSPPATVRVSE